MSVVKNVYRFKGNFKGLLFICALILAFGFLYYTQLLVNELKEQSRDFLNLRVKLFEQNINSDETQDLSFFFSEIIQTADYPIIYTDSENYPAFWKNIDIPPASANPINADTLQILEKLINEFDETNKPVPISYQGSILGYYHYGESAIIKRLRWLPYIELVIVVLFILIGYAGFSSIKKSEERYIWVGMAKETAHQLGTPLSSLIGWVEYLKGSPEKFLELSADIERDLGRLQMVTNRFSKIGSVPDLKNESMNEIMDDILSYFSRRLPAKHGKISLIANLDENIRNISVNRDLFSWVLENLIKNAADAIDKEQGTIVVQTGELNGSSIFIDVIDNGKGIESRDRKNVFNPGFSTKKRGWGLGLSLAKRIIEEYHGGSLLLKESVLNKGSVFRIILIKS